VRQFLVEVFAPRSSTEELLTAEKRARAASQRVSREGAAVRYLQAIYVPEDETCFYIFEATAADIVGEASHLAGLGAARIVETFAEPETPERANRKERSP
jgi:hypothetical protein